jgi:hypothetical protein
MSSYPYVINSYLEYKIVKVVFFYYCKSSPMYKISKTKSRVFKHCTYIKLRHPLHNAVKVTSINI